MSVGSNPPNLIQQLSLNIPSYSSVGSDAKDQIKNAGEFGTMGMSRMVTHVEDKEDRLSWRKLETLLT